MTRDENEGRRKRGGEPGETTGEEMTRERARDGESATGRAGGTGRFISPEEEDAQESGNERGPEAARRGP